MEKEPESKDSPIRKTNRAKSKSKKDFLVVGLGASAGGVKALQEFFATMPPDSGMAFVAILHLSPEHESSLPAILQAQTKMKVTQVRKTIKVEPDNVYVIPPNVQLEMVDGVIRPVKAERPTGHRIAIDFFFRTLAEAYERNAVCVVMSGTGSDGTLGLKRVKESNGFAIVQDPEDAEYDSMPRSAINTQLADWVLPVHQMPEKLIHFRKSSEKLHLTNGADAKLIAEEINADESLREILTLLRVRTGHDFSNYKTPTLVRRIARHLQIHELTDIPSYLELLRNHPDEIQSLLKNLLINVTNFFRDNIAFESLEMQVVPNLFDGKTGKDAVRVWSCGCASGEEAFSLAMILQEFADTLSDPPKIQVFASDVDDDAITEAREHRYPESIEADVSSERLKRFFVKEGAYYRIKKELRETVLFAPHNVLRDPPFSRLDLITCRNLLIYLNRETQERVLQIFHFALRAQGYLFLGSSETAETLTTLYSAVDKRHRLYSRRTAQVAQTSMPIMPVAGRWEVRLPERKAESTRDRAATLSEIHYKLLENYAPSSILVNQEFDIVYLSGTAGKFLRFSGGEPSRNLLKAINPDLLPDLRAALFTAQREHKSSEFPNIRVVIEGVERIINLIVRVVDVQDETSDFLLVIFEERNSPAVIRETEREIKKITNKDKAMESVVRRLEEDLQRTKEHLRYTIEQHETSVEELKASNEELQAINEELRSASEELETSKEELQSVNEELTTVNHELKDKIDETSRINSDLSNLMAATDIATIFLDKNLRIKRYTPPVEEFFNITKADIGRPLEHFTHKLNYDELAKDATQVLKKLAPLELEITDKKGRHYLARFAPYRTLDDRIDGIVLNFIDITERKRIEENLAFLAEVSQNLVRMTDVAETMNSLGAKIASYLDLSACAFAELDETESVAFINYGWHRADVASLLGTYRMKEFMASKVVENCRAGKAVIVRSVFDDSRFDGEQYAALNIGSFVSIPLIRNGEWRFLFVVYKTEPYNWRDDEIELLREIINRIWAWLERARTGDALTKSEELFRLVSDAVPAVIYDWNVPEDKIVRSNELENLLGFSPDDPETQTNKWWKTRLHPEDAKTAIEKVAENLKSNEYRFEDEYRLKHRDGHYVWVSDTGILLRDDTGTVTRWVGSATDITERKEAAEALRESEEKYRTQLEQDVRDRTAELTESKGLLQATIDAPDIGIAVYRAARNEKGEIIDFVHEYINRASIDMLGGEDFTGKLLSDHGENGTAQLDSFKEVIETGRGNAYIRETIFRGRDVWFSVTNTPLDGERLVHTWEDVTERENTEAEILRLKDEIAQKATDKYESLFNSIDEGFCIVEVIFDKRGKAVDYRFLETNPAFFKETGMGNAIGKTMRELAPKHEQFWFDTYGEIAKTRKPARFDHKAEALNSWYEVYAFPVGEPGEKQIAILFRDIAERRKTEEIIRESEERLRIAVEAAALGTWEWDLTNDTVIWNERHFQLLGMSPLKNPFPAEVFFEHVHKDDRERVEKLLEQSIKKGKAFEAEFCIVRDDGKMRWMEGYGHVIEQVKGKAVRMAGVMSDITERKNIAEAVRKSEERMQLILRSITDYAVITSDPQGIINGWNTGAENTFGWTEQEAVGKSCDIIFTPEDRKAKIPEKEMAIALIEGIAEDRRWHVRKDGTRFFSSGTVSPIQNGEFDGFVKITSDQTARMEVEKALHERELLHQFVRTQEDERQRIARDIHDQLGQQLTVLRLKIANLKKTCAEMDVPNNKEAVAQIEELQKTGEQIDRDVDFLAWELRPASLEDLGLRLTLQNFVKEWANYTGIKAGFQTTGVGKVRLTNEIETNLYRIAQEALNNILKHAKASNISVILEKRRETLVLIVEDDGIGFDVNKKPKGARGLGIVGMSERAKIIGGEFEIESEKGKGTTVFVRVPVKMIR